MSARYILAESPDLLYAVTGLDGGIVSTNDLFKEYSSHIKPKKISDLIAEPSDVDDFITKVEKAIAITPSPVRLYARTRQKSGAMNWTRWNIFCILSSLHFIGIPIADVTSISAHEYERQNKLLDDLRFMISHELRHPLSSISGLVKLLIDKGDNDENSEIIKMIHESVNKLDESVHLLVKKASREL